jgi:hypothetical protein
MADTFEALLRTRLQQTGNNRNTWGDLLNTNTLNLLAKSIAGRVEITIAGTDVTLTTNLGAEDQARYAVLDLIGAPGAARNVIVPSVSHIYIVRNGTGQDITIKTAAGAGAEIENGATSQVLCDGTNCQVVSPSLPEQAQDSAKLGGIIAASWARLDAAQAFSMGQKFVPVPMSMGAAVAPDAAVGNVFTGVLTENTTLNAPANLDPDNAQVFYVHLQQAATGGPYTLALASFYNFLGAGDPTIGTTASSNLLLACVYLPELGQALCFAVSDTDTVATPDITLAANENNVDVFRRAGSPAGAVTLNVTIAAGVTIHTDSPLEPALDFSGGFASGATINLINLGHVIGRGGCGGDGGLVHDDGDTGFATAMNAGGEAGGNAIKGPGSGRTLNITNANGRIWGGGGGGGAGGASADDPGLAAPGGGGGGAGMGDGGKAGRGTRRAQSDAVVAANGVRGRLNLDGTAAGGAAGAGTAGTGGYVGASGAGGDYGAAGTNGAAQITGALRIAATNGGAAGKAVDVNSSTVNFVSGSGSPNVKGAVS